MQGKIVLIGGSKGGVGKSIVASALIDMMRHRNQPPIVVDSDTSNPDVYKCHKEILDCHTLDLDRKEGWIALLNIVHSTDKTVVINSAARNNTGVECFGSLLMDALPDLGRELVTFWVINRQRDSLELLKQYRSTIRGEVHVVRNLHAGEADKFELFNTSKLRLDLETSGGKVLDFPDLADRVADVLMNKRIAIAEAGENLTFGERIELQRWRKVIHTELQKAA